MRKKKLSKTAILVDVDKTLLGLFNKILQATCKWNLINLLAKNGIKVVSVLTPADVSYGRGPDRITLTFLTSNNIEEIHLRAQTLLSSIMPS